jgi:hypothetical protein
MLRLMLIISFASACHAAVPTTRYVCERASAEIHIDGVLDDAAWKHAQWSKDFGDITGKAKLAPKLRTRMKMLWDDEKFYLAVECEDPNVWATMKKRDEALFMENAVEIFIDPDDDGKNYAEIQANPLGTIMDVLMDKPFDAGGKANEKWDAPGMKIAAHVDGTVNDPSDKDRGWTIEAAIPWTALRELGVTRPPRDGEQWRMNFAPAAHESKGAKDQYWTWSPQGEIKMHVPKRWGFVQWKK